MSLCGAAITYQLFLIINAGRISRLSTEKPLTQAGAYGRQHYAPSNQRHVIIQVSVELRLLALPTQMMRRGRQDSHPDGWQISVAYWTKRE
jgi:hypothetical protein